MNDQPTAPKPDSAAQTMRVQAAFGAALRHHRSEKWITLQELASKSGVDAGHINAIERGERNVALLDIWRLANGLDLPVAQLVDDLPR